MKTIFLFCSTLLVVLFTSCAGPHGSYDLHKTLGLIIIICIIVLFLVLSIYSNMLRDEVNDCDGFPAGTKNPFSLSRVQLAGWTVIISCSFVYLEFCKVSNCDIIDINQTALILMGIGAGITTAGTLIDKREIQNNTARHQNAPSDNFFADILSDNNGISIPRVQNVVWTVIAMLVYLNKVYMTKTGCALPELSETLLALTGISGATYVVLKSQENATPATVSTPAAIIPPASIAPPAVMQAPVIADQPPIAASDPTVHVVSPGDQTGSN